MNDWVLLVIVALPLVALWLRSLVEVALRRHGTTKRNLVWLLVLVAVPVVGLAAYVVARTPRPVRLSGGGPGAGRAEQLVLLAERRQRGDLTDAGFQDAVNTLRRPE